MRTQELLDQVAARYALRSDYQLFKFLGVSKSTVSRWRHGGQLGDKEAVKVAELLDLDPGEVLAEIYAERTDCRAAREAWLRVARIMAAQKRAENQKDISAD